MASASSETINAIPLMRAAGRRPVEAAFTHGTSEQRMAWLRKGLETGDARACNTFADMRRGG